MKVNEIRSFLTQAPDPDVELQVMQLPETLYTIKEIRQTSSGDVVLVIESKKVGSVPDAEPYQGPLPVQATSAFERYQDGPDRKAD